MQLENSSGVVTGGASGLGAATVAALAAQGVRVTAFDLQPSIDKMTELGQAVDGVTYAAVDVTDAEAVAAAVRRHGVHLAHGGAHQGVLLGLEAFVEAAARRSAAGSGEEAGS